jgi:hypothetical protein
MDKNSERYKILCENPKFVRREARLWYKALNEHNKRVFFNIPKYSYRKEDYHI